jgi:hypothetical protein
VIIRNESFLSQECYRYRWIKKITSEPQQNSSRDILNESNNNMNLFINTYIIYDCKSNGIDSENFFNNPANNSQTQITNTDTQEASSQEIFSVLKINGNIADNVLASLTESGQDGASDSKKVPGKGFDHTIWSNEKFLFNNRTEKVMGVGDLIDINIDQDDIVMLQEPVYFKFIKEETEFSSLYDLIKGPGDLTQENAARHWGKHFVSNSGFTEEYYWPGVICLPFKDNLKDLLTVKGARTKILYDDLNFTEDFGSGNQILDQTPRKKPGKVKKNVLIWLFGTNKYLVTSPKFLADFESVNHQTLMKCFLDPKGSSPRNQSFDQRNPKIYNLLKSYLYYAFNYFEVIRSNVINVKSLAPPNIPKLNSQNQDA